MPTSDQYDVIVVGAGFGGISAAACMARLGKHVLAVDRLDGPGGVGHAFQRGEYTFDPAVHIVPQANDGELLDVYLRFLGVRDRVEFIPLRPLYGTVFPGERYTLPVGVDAYIDAHAGSFPESRRDIEGYVRLCAAVTRESQSLPPTLALRDLDQAAQQFPLLFRYRTATVGEVLSEVVVDPRVRALLAAAWPYVGLPPAKLNFVTYSAVIMSTLERGAMYVRGGIHKLAEAFANALLDHGGELLLGTEVTGVLVEDGRSAGVMLDGGGVVRAPVVISNADARHTFDNLVGREHLSPKYVTRYERMQPSLSAFALFSATTLDLAESDLAHETFVHPSWDHDEAYNGVLNGALGGMWLSLPTLHDPSLAPPGEHLLIFTSMMAYDIGIPWSEARDRYTEMALDVVEEIVPGYRGSITYLESATPKTFERYTLAHRGAIYGWDAIRSQVVPKRLPNQTPIENLYLVGHWTNPGAGSFRCMYSGILVSQLVLGYHSIPALLDLITEQAGY